MSARYSGSTVLIVAAVVGAAAFAAGRSLHSEPSGGSSAEVAPGHPAIDTHAPAAHTAPEVAERSLAWKVPARWQVVPSASTMRLATYRIPHAPGDDEDPEMAVSQAGGSLDANIDRWIGQFGPEAKKTAKRTTRKVAGMDVTIVEIEGTFAGGMGMKKDDRPSEGWALLGAIVETPGMAHFFKMTGPAKSVRAARGELDTLIASLDQS